MKKIKSIYVREIGELGWLENIDIRIRADGIIETEKPEFTYNQETNTYHQGNTEYKGEHIISVTYE